MSSENPHTPVGLEGLAKVLNQFSHNMVKGSEFYGKTAVYADKSKRPVVEQAMQCCDDISLKIDEVIVALELLRKLQAQING